MGEVTRDEVRRACESVGWNVKRGYPFQRHDAEDARIGESRFRRADRRTEDTLALLEATGCPYTIDRHLRPEPSWIVHIEHPGMGHGTMSGDSLFEAGIRAVLAWKEARHA